MEQVQKEKAQKTGRQNGNCGGANPQEDSSTERGFGRRPRGRGMGKNQLDKEEIPRQ